MPPLLIWCRRKGVFCGYVCSYGAGIAWKTDEVASFNKSCSVWFLLLGSVVAKKKSVCDVFYSVCWYFIVCQGKKCVGVLHSDSYYLCQAPQLIGKIFHLCFYVFFAFHEVYIFYVLSCFIINYVIDHNIEILVIRHVWLCYLDMVCIVCWFRSVVYYFQPYFLYLVVFVTIGERALSSPLPPSVVNTCCPRMGYGL